ncbi:MAG: DUF3054 domain-containing protein [Actinomycetia bacterium]|nr:DUF3054 domain-containing protein [Actinomycetes bacterium]MCH9708440.1 DUF3054 domain-containing protein [Actinomycetes bacterium]MCH9767773.1 DUF3054 domain-containing protein [Actinomycetes bacterium]
MAYDEQPLQSSDRPRTGAALGAYAADVLCVVVFCAIGRRTHAEWLTVAGIAETAWPFLTGTTLGWLISRGWRRPAVLAPTGVVVWICTVAIGMVLRRVTSQGTATSFIVVATLTTALLLLGWRVAARLINR